MNVLKFLTGLAVSVTLAACGGGGGNPGTSSGGTEVVPVVSTATSLSLQLRDVAGSPTQSVGATAGAEIVATLLTAAGTPLASQTINFSEAGTSLVSFPSVKSVVTDSKGVAKIKVTRANAFKFGSGSFGASFDAPASSGTCTAINICLLASTNSLSFVVEPPALRMELRDSANAVTTSVSSSGFTTLRASLKFDDGTPVAQKRIDIVGDLSKISFPEGSSQLTDSSGVAVIKISRASLTVSGAGSLNASTTITGADSAGVVSTTVVTGLVDYQIGQANIALTGLNLGSSALPAYGNRPISVVATINGVAASSSPVQVTFNTSCGTVTPAAVTTDSTGTANTTYSASLATCAGTTVTVSASAVGATPVAGSVIVSPSIATNVQFISTTPQLIYLKDSVGTTQAQVVFKVVDSSGNPLQNKKLRLALSNTAIGVSLDTVGNVLPVDLTSDSAGLVSAAVFSGTVPASLNVKATLLDASGATTAVFSNSNLLTVASGRPTQRSLSLALGKLSIEGQSIDGETTTVTLSMSDRQGNPVPPGTQVNLVAETGVLLPAVCFVPPVIPATSSSPAIPVSSCTVNFRSQGTRTANGLVSIMAYTAGEEDFVDVNGNNVFDASDTFTDLGRAYRDDNSKGVTAGTALNGNPISVKNNIYDAGEFQVPRDGVSACLAGTGCVGDGVWGAADVRTQAMIVLATSGAIANFTTENPAATSSFAELWLADGNNNSVPTGSTLTVTATKDGCKPAVFPSVIANTLEPSRVRLSYTTASNACSGDSLQLTVTTPRGSGTTFSIRVP